ncbi:gluconate:H+ symporter [Robbsia sp. Bb-Pol-6]|uniref:Gluconate:H+ symporter n=1 Tax=Robbsia betulipollinis TaxID=2981849 RepID=A0ABT3ZL97_9BURK|nr:gluconate:H+ symporter [Robbsia betulipollinis]MCY0387304.1 gluconate:H+ symporter [Robbsia betulipollinis]
MNHTLAAAGWLPHDTQLIVAGALALAVIITLIAALKIAPYLAILVGTFVAGAAAGLPLEKVSTAFSRGAGALLGDVGIIIALGAMLGALMAESGAAERLVDAMLKHSSKRMLPWMMALVAIIIGLPLFFEVGLVMMVPIIFVMARRSGQPVLRIAIPALAGMTTLHALLPPHPGPLIAVSALHADLGLTLALGFVAAIPAVILAGPLYGMWLAPRLANRKRGGIVESIGESLSTEGPPAHGDAARRPDTPDTAERRAWRQPSFAAALTTILLPVILMLGRTVARLALPGGSTLAEVLDFLGEPLVALTLTVLLAIVLFGWSTGRSRIEVGRILRRSAPPIAILLLTIGAGGGLKQTLVLAGISDTVGKIATGSHLPLLLLAYLIAVALRQATGSATVATTTTAGILAPLATHLAPAHASLVALSIGAGSVFFCHVNDAGFWMVREYFGLELKETIWVWSILQTIVSVVGLGMVLLMWQILV